MPGNRIPDGVECVYEIIVSGPKMEHVRQGMRVGIETATTVPGVKEIHTANYGGKLGKGKVYLRSLSKHRQPRLPGRQVAQQGGKRMLVGPCGLDRRCLCSNQQGIAENWRAGGAPN